MGGKQIRDPIYNYIALDAPFIQLVNTPEFQRLRNIRQTSYEALYPSALHNRFVHSLGVFHLGGKAIDYFWENSKPVISPKFRERLEAKSSDGDGMWDMMKRTFLYACLLHDVGHSPFSHTGEKQYLKGIYFEEALQTALYPSKDDGQHNNREIFQHDMGRTDPPTGAPHEAMSALIGLDLCDKFQTELDRELFVRCIIGLKYQSDPRKSQEEKAFLNAVIGLLNGALMDVDKLDYIVRDSYVTGYNNLSIDLDRLLAGYTLYQDNGEYLTGYRKGALSVIENVIYANDLERRWIQNHPSVLYDGYLVESLLGQFDAYMCRRDGRRPKNRPAIPTAFTRQALSQEGMSGLRQPIKLLCDADILAYIKNVSTSKASRQYLDRSTRLKPLWKTEASFTPLTKDLGPELLGEIQKDITILLDMIKDRREPFINDDALAFLEERCEKAPKDGSHPRKDCLRAKHICDIFHTFQQDYGLPEFEFALIQAKRFRSGYSKAGIESVRVELDSGFVPLTDVMSVQAKETAANMDKEFFYVFTTAANLRGRQGLAADFFDHLRRKYDKHSA